MDVEVDPDWGAPPSEEPVVAAASDKGAGMLGFAGAASKSDVTEAAGLTTLVGDGFGGGLTMPMVPGATTTAVGVRRTGADRALTVATCLILANMSIS